MISNIAYIFSHDTRPISKQIAHLKLYWIFKERTIFVLFLNKNEMLIASAKFEYKGCVRKRGAKSTFDMAGILMKLEL